MVPDLTKEIEEAIRDAPPVQKAGDIYTLGTFERALRNLQHPFYSEHRAEPSQEELRRAVQTIREAFGKRAFLHTPERDLEGILQPSGYLGVYFTHYRGSRAAKYLFSQEDLKLERKEPVYEFSTASLGNCFLLYGLENIAAKYSLRKARVKPVISK